MNKSKVLRERSIRIVAVSLLILGTGIVIASSAVLASSQAPAGEQSAASGQSKPSSQYSRLPEGPGKDTLIRVCGKCHSPTNVIANGQSRDGWEAEITKMAGFGASASDEEFTEILDYLAKNFPPVTGKINMNKVTAADLESQLGFSGKQAGDIVAYREKNGAFKSIEDVKKVPGLDAKEVDVRKNRMTF